MKSTIVFLIGITAMIFIGVFAALAYKEQHFPDNARAALNQFMFYRAANLVEFSRASTPAKFDRPLSGVSYGDSLIYHSDQNYREPMNVLLPNEPTVMPNTDNGRSQETQCRTCSARPIPFPPVDVWCAVVQSGNQVQLVFVALHQDLYNAEWFVHVPPGDASPTQWRATIQSIGCSLKSIQ